MTVSASFNDGARYNANPRYTARLHYVYNTANTAALTEIASSLHNNIPCKLHPKFSAGEFNLVRVLDFEDGVRWVARLRMPGIEGFGGGVYGQGLGSVDRDGEKGFGNGWKWTERDGRGFKSEVETMRFIRKYTSIPVPEVFASDASPNNPVNFPYILMSYIHGTTAFDRATLAGEPMRVPPQFFNHYIDQISAIMNELASIRAQCIGSIYTVPVDGQLIEECMGPIAETQSGPWRDTAEFCREYPRSLMCALYGDSPESRTASGGEKTINLFIEIFGTHNHHPTISSEHESDFVLVNLELGAHNVLVDEHFNILSVIDWDSTFAAPRAVLHHFPWCIGADPGIPGGKSRIFPPLDGQRDMTLGFCRALAEHATSRDASGPGEREGKGKELFTVREFFTKEALAFRAIAFFRVRQTWVDEEWVEGLEWLRGRKQEDIWDWYGIKPVITD